MKTKKKYIAPKIEVIEIIQESLLQGLSNTEGTDNTGGNPGPPDNGEYARPQHNKLSWDDWGGTGKSVWDD